MSSEAKTPAAKCPICGRTVGVINPGGSASPYYRRHRLGMSADWRKGQSPRAACGGSYTAAPRPQPEVTTWPGSC